MIKAMIKNKEISLDRGLWSCNDLELLRAIKELSTLFDLEYHGYHPQPELQLMEWICEKTKGSILHIDEPDEFDLDVEY